MKKIFTSVITFFLLVNLNAQRVDLDRFNFSYTYRDFPEEPLPDQYKTFNIRIEATPGLGIDFSIPQYTREINIEGLKKVEGTGHITALLILDDILVEKSELKERIQVTKNKQGIEEKKSFFSTEMIYSFSARLSVFDYKGQTLISNRILSDRSNKKTFKTPEQGSASDANSYFSNKAGEIRNNLSKQLAAGVIVQAGDFLNTQYGYPVRRVNDIFWILNNKRHASYRDQQKAWNDFRNAVVLINENEPLVKAKEKMQPVINYFEKAKKQYSGTDKEDRKMRYASYYNLAKIYLCLDEPEKAIAEADALSMNDYDEKDGKYLRASAEQLKEKLRKSNSSTRHFEINTESYAGPIR